MAENVNLGLAVTNPCDENSAGNSAYCTVAPKPATILNTGATALEAYIFLALLLIILLELLVIIRQRQKLEELRNQL